MQRRLSIYNWNPGPRRGNEDASEKQIAGKWHIITLQEASEYVVHDILAGRFHVTLHAGCAILFNKDTFHTNVDVKSINLHDTKRDLPDQVMEGEQGWVAQGVLSRASFRRSPVKYFTVCSLHVSNIYAKKKGIAKKFILTLRAIMTSQEVDFVAGDFNGTAWWYRSEDNLSTIDAIWPHTTVDLDPFRTIGQTSADFSNHRVLTVFGKCISMVHSPSHGKRLVHVPPIKVATTRHGSTWISSIGTTMIGTFPLKNDLLLVHTGT